MLIKTAKGSISMVAGCSWVNYVSAPPPLKRGPSGLISALQRLVKPAAAQHMQQAPETQPD
jgi:hypothetical protein